MKKILALLLAFSPAVMAQSPCNVADILFYDNTCGPELVEGKHPIGIVIAPVRRVAISLNQKILEWSSLETDIEISSPKGLMPTKDAALQEFSGQELAGAFQEIAPNFYPAIQYCSSMNWANGQAWYVPELGLINQIYQRKTEINITLAKINNAQELENNFYWSGSQYSYSQSWQQTFFDGYIRYQDNNNKAIVRCAINY